MLALLTACTPAGPPGPTAGPDGPAVPDEPRRGGAVTLAVTANVPSMSIIGEMSSTTTGGWAAAGELHSSALITSDLHARQPVGRLVARVPSLENGDIALLPDGRMRVVYPLRPGVTWHDGTPFTARDLVFSYQLNSDPGIPSIQSDVIRLMQSVEAPDDQTFIAMFKGPYYRADQMGLRVFWPHPRHLLQAAYDQYLTTKNPDEVVNHPYWTFDYVHLGPFRVASFDPADTIVLEAYDGYFLGRPKLDTVRIRVFTDPNTLYANLLSGTVDSFLENTLAPNLGFELKERWESTRDGTVHVKRSAQRFLVPQMRPEVLTEAAILDVRVRAGLYHALDREALTEGLQSGHRELAAWELIFPGETLHEATKDAFRRYAYDPERAKAMLRDLGWTPGPDGFLQHSSDARRFRTSISATAGRIGEQEIPAFADYWRRIGVEVEQLVIPGAFVRNGEYRALYPGWEATASAGGDGILGRFEGPAASAQNRWIGNRAGYDAPRAQQLIDVYRASLSSDAQFQAMRAISDFVAADLPILVLYSTAVHIGTSTRLQALDDHAGGDSGGRPYGTYSRNGHLWELR